MTLDLIHILEYPWSAAWALFTEADPAAEMWVSQHLHAILSGHSSTVAAGLRRSATLRQLSPKQREPLDRCADYLLKYRDFAVIVQLVPVTVQARCVAAQHCTQTGHLNRRDFGILMQSHAHLIQKDRLFQVAA